MTTTTPGKPDRTWRYILLGFVGLWIAYLAFLLPRTDDGPPPPRLEGTGSTLPADYGWALQDLDGKPVAFSTFKGRPVVLNFWATWCPPCREEMPSLVRLAAEARLKGVAFVCVTGESAAAIDKVKAYAASEMPGLTVLRAEGVPAVFESDGIPATFLIDAEGRVLASETGAAKWDDPSVVNFLEALARKARPASN